MAKSSSTKPSSSSASSTKPKKAAVVVEKTTAQAPATKSLKRKKDAAEPPVAKDTSAEPATVAEPSSKKSKTAKAMPTPKFAAAAALSKSSPAPPKPTKSEKQKPKKADKAKTSHSRTRQLEPEPVPSLPLEDDVEEGDEEEEEVHLHGFSTDEDSSDEEDDMDAVSTAAFDVASLPTISKDDATVKKKLEKAKRNPTGNRGVLFLGRIPHGFYEEQMKAYFSQFGDVTRIRLSRNKKTGKSKHYGFIEFDSASVAKIVADTMDNYLLNGHIMQCKVIPKEKVHPELWVGANRKWRTVPPDQLTRASHNKKRDGEQQYAASRRLVKRQNQRKRKLEEMGINYDFEGAGYKKIATKAVDSTK